MSVHYKYAYYDETGKRRVKTFTAETLTKAKRKAKDWKNEQPNIDHPDMTVEDCVVGYIAIKTPILSPTTIRSYNSIKENRLGGIKDIPLSELNKRTIQGWVSQLVVSGLSAKTVRNCYALLRSALLMYDETLAFRVQLPTVITYQNYCPSDEDVKKLIEEARKTDEVLFRAILLTTFGLLREGEVCALTSEDVHGNTISINKSMAYTKDHAWVIKTPKTPASIRELEYPQFVIDLVKDVDGRLVPLTPHALYDRFRRLVKRLDVPYFRFHDIRHYGCSILHSLGIPDAYVMARGGWATDVMKRVYRNVISDEQKKQTQIIMEHFDSLLQN